MTVPGLIEENLKRLIYLHAQRLTAAISQGGYGINAQVEKSKKMTTVNFMGYDLNKLF